VRPLNRLIVTVAVSGLVLVTGYSSKKSASS
jgi:hypothetical protein